MPSSHLAVGLIGYGPAGSVFHAPLIESAPGLRLAAVVTGDAARGADVRARHPRAAVVPDADALFALAGEIDVVVIAAPNRAHVPLAERAIDAGLAVVVDKPMAPDAEGARGLTARAQAAGVLLTVFHNRRWDGDFLTLADLVRGGRLGPVARFESRFERWRPRIRPGWREQPGAGEAGGVLFDLGPHLIDQALQLFGPATTVYAEVDTRRPGALVDDDSFVALTHATGVRSQLWMSAAAAQAGPRFRVLAERGAYVKWGLDGQEDALRRGERPGPGWGREDPGRWGRLGADGASEAVPARPGAYPAFYAGLVAALRDGAPAPVAPTDAVAGLEVIGAARASAASGRVISLI